MKVAKDAAFASWSGLEPVFYLIKAMELTYHRFLSRAVPDSNAAGPLEARKCLIIEHLVYNETATLNSTSVAATRNNNTKWWQSLEPRWSGERKDL